MINNPFSTPGPTDRLVIYLNDHRALVAAEISTAHRCRSSNEGSMLAHDLTNHIGHSTRDLDLVDELIRDAGGTTDQVKAFGALTAERLGRFKLNGQLFKYSPLSRVIELETLIAGMRARALLWDTLQQQTRSLIDPDRFIERSDVAIERLAVLEAHHRDATQVAFDVNETET